MPGWILRLRAGTRGRKIMEFLALASAGMTSRDLAEASGEEPCQQMLTRYGDILRTARDAGWIEEAGRTQAGRRQGAAIVYRITGQGRLALAEARDGRAPAPRRPRSRHHPWDADALRRSHAGESITALAREYGVSRETVKRSIARQGGTPSCSRVTRKGSPALMPQPDWAHAAARRYRAGEGAAALRREYGVSALRMRIILEREGVTIRGRGRRPVPRAREVMTGGRSGLPAGPGVKQRARRALEDAPDGLTVPEATALLRESRGAVHMALLDGLAEGWSVRDGWRRGGRNVPAAVYRSAAR